MDYGLIIVTIVCFAIMIAGLISIIFPFLPSIPFIWLGIFLYAVATKFEKIDEKFVLTITIMLLAVILLDYITEFWGLKRWRFSFWAVFGAVLGGIIGSFFNLVLGLLLGALVGALIAEVLSGQDITFAIKMKKYTIICFVAGTIIKLAVGVSMIGMFIYKLIQ